uniref:glycosyltransferase n=1 Tax=Flavobacterium sp. TaxID=239 RepID=UPI00404B09E9
MFSIIVPVFNRPDEINELLQSLTQQTYHKDFEVVIIEDGSTETCAHLIPSFASILSISYIEKPNSGPGDSRNFGMRKAKGDYFIIFDSDCLIPPTYLETVDAYLQNKTIDCFGGPDAASESFTDLQKAINHVMTSFLTTGGVRGKNETVGKFQPRSFNMGISKRAFVASGGFGTIHPGEDPDLVFRLWDLGFDTILIKNAFVYHKRRISWKKFYQQVHKFGKVRPILNHWHPSYKKWSFYLPMLWLFFLVFSVIMAFLQVYEPLILILIHMLAVFMEALLKTKKLKIAYLSLLAMLIQFSAYAIGFMKTLINVQFFGKNPKETNPELFFD